MNQNGPGFSNTFPYVGLPNMTAVNGGASVGDGNPQPVPPAAAAPAGNAGTPAAAAAGAQAAANRYPVGGVETGEGGLADTVVPALTGSLALALLGAGGISLIRGRQQRRTVTPTTEV